MDDQRPPIEMSVEIDAPPELVWAALTEADRLVGWFAGEARSTPGEGGEIWVSWGPDVQGTSRIEVWEPERRLRLADTGPPNLTVDFTLEVRGGRTVLRLVHAGFGRSSWDDEYEGVRRGWNVFLAALRHALEHHADQRWHAWSRSGRVDRTPAQAWEAVGKLDGTVLVSEPPHAACVALADAVLAVFLDPADGGTFATIAQFSYGEQARSSALVERLAEEVGDGRI